MYPNQPVTQPGAQPDPLAPAVAVSPDVVVPQPQVISPDVTAPQFAQPAVAPVSDPTVVAAAPQMPAFMQPDPIMTQTAPDTLPGVASIGENTDKSYLLALGLSYLLGFTGLDRLYLGKKRSAILKMVTLGGVGVWYAIDLLMVAYGSMRATGDPRPLSGFAKEYTWTKTGAIVLVIFNPLVFACLLILFIVSGVMTANSL